jgi:hypothetical protein
MLKNKKLFVGMLLLVLLFGIVPMAFAQSYEYHISSGLFKASDGWSITCYSGASGYRDDPSKISVKDKGPIPTGAFYITGVTSSKGPNTIVLQPDGNNDMYGRTDFRIHGDNSTGTASSGCIIMGPNGRQKIVDAYNKARANGVALTVYVYAN